MNDKEWYESLNAGEDAGWKLVWERVIVPEKNNPKHAEMMRRHSLDEGDLMGKLYEDMLGRGKISLFRGEGSLEGWLKAYVRGYILNANPNRHGEISIESARDDEDSEIIDLPVQDAAVDRKDVWISTHYCFHDLWMKDPFRAYIHLLKTRFQLSSSEVRDFLDVSSAANVDQIFSRNVKFLREAWFRRNGDRNLRKERESR